MDEWMDEWSIYISQYVVFVVLCDKKSCVRL